MPAIKKQRYSNTNTTSSSSKPLEKGIAGITNTTTNNTINTSNFPSILNKQSLDTRRSNTNEEFLNLIQLARKSTHTEDTLLLVSDENTKVFEKQPNNRSSSSSSYSSSGTSSSGRGGLSTSLSDRFMVPRSTAISDLKKPMVDTTTNTSTHSTSNPIDQLPTTTTTSTSSTTTTAGPYTTTQGTGFIADNDFYISDNTNTMTCSEYSKSNLSSSSSTAQTPSLATLNQAFRNKLSMPSSHSSSSTSPRPLFEVVTQDIKPHPSTSATVSPVGVIQSVNQPADHNSSTAAGPKPSFYSPHASDTVSAVSTPPVATLNAIPIDDTGDSESEAPLSQCSQTSVTSTAYTDALDSDSPVDMQVVDESKVTSSNPATDDIVSSRLPLIQVLSTLPAAVQQSLTTHIVHLKASPLTGSRELAQKLYKAWGKHIQQKPPKASTTTSTSTAGARVGKKKAKTKATAKTTSSAVASVTLLDFSLVTSVLKCLRKLRMLSYGGDKAVLMSILTSCLFEILLCMELLVLYDKRKSEASSSEGTVSTTTTTCVGEHAQRAQQPSCDERAMELVSTVTECLSRLSLLLNQGSSVGMTTSDHEFLCGHQPTKTPRSSSKKATNSSLATCIPADKHTKELRIIHVISYLFQCYSTFSLQGHSDAQLAKAAAYDPYSTNTTEPTSPLSASTPDFSSSAALQSLFAELHDQYYDQLYPECRGIVSPVKVIASMVNNGGGSDVMPNGVSRSSSYSDIDGLSQCSSVTDALLPSTTAPATLPTTTAPTNTSTSSTGTATHPTHARASHKGRPPKKVNRLLAASSQDSDMASLRVTRNQLVSKSRHVKINKSTSSSQPPLPFQFYTASTSTSTTTTGKHPLNTLTNNSSATTGHEPASKRSRTSTSTTSSSSSTALRGSEEEELAKVKNSVPFLQKLMQEKRAQAKENTRPSSTSTTATTSATSLNTTLNTSSNTTVEAMFLSPTKSPPTSRADLIFSSPINDTPVELQGRVAVMGTEVESSAIQQQAPPVSLTRNLFPKTP